MPLRKRKPKKKPKQPTPEAKEVEWKKSYAKVEINGLTGEVRVCEIDGFFTSGGCYCRYGEEEHEMVFRDAENIKVYKNGLPKGRTVGEVIKEGWYPEDE